MRPVEAYELKLAAIRYMKLQKILAKEKQTAAIEELLAAKRDSRKI